MREGIPSSYPPSDPSSDPSDPSDLQMPSSAGNSLPNRLCSDDVIGQVAFSSAWTTHLDIRGSAPGGRVPLKATFHWGNDGDLSLTNLHFDASTITTYTASGLFQIQPCNHVVVKGCVVENFEVGSGSAVGLWNTQATITSSTFRNNRGGVAGATAMQGGGSLIFDVMYIRGEHSIGCRPQGQSRIGQRGGSWCADSMRQKFRLVHDNTV